MTTQAAPANQAFVRRLRALADFYEARPELPIPYQLDDTRLLVFLSRDKKIFRQQLRAVGSFTKNYPDDGWFEAETTVGGQRLCFTVQREAVCERKVVGTKIVPQEVIPSKFTPEQVIPEHEEEIVEWDCGPVLGETEDEAKAAVTAGAQ